MGFLNINGAALSSLQTWVVIVVAAGTLGVSVLRENKTASVSQEIREVVVEQSIDIGYLKNGQDEIKAEQIQIRKESDEHLEFAEGVLDDVNDLKESQQEIINIGKFYIEHQDELNDEQMRDVMNELLKKNGLTPYASPIVSVDTSGRLDFASITETENLK